MDKTKTLVSFGISSDVAPVQVDRGVKYEVSYPGDQEGRDQERSRSRHGSSLVCMYSVQGTLNRVAFLQANIRPLR